MKANELRIKNWVFNGKNIQVTSKQIDLFNDGVYDLLPIPLTEEWLLKFGFDKEKDWCGNEKEGSYELNGYYYDMEDKDLLYIDNYGYESFCEYQLKHVHQLQNLSFALTGEELKLKDNE